MAQLSIESIISIYRLTTLRFNMVPECRHADDLLLLLLYTRIASLWDA